MEQIISIKEKKIDDVRVVAIVLAQDWFDKFSFPILPDDYVVCQWSDFHDGVNSHIEGKTTIAICRNPKDALLIYNSQKRKKQ
jgi:hypothetical protein